MTMPKGPKGQKRPADSLGCAVMVAQIATGEMADITDTPGNRAAGAAARSVKLSPAKRSEIARIAANSRWKNDA